MWQARPSLKTSRLLERLRVRRIERRCRLVADTRGDDTCDASLECEALEWDGGDCTAPVVGDACDYEGWSGVEPFKSGGD